MTESEKNLSVGGLNDPDVAFGRLSDVASYLDRIYALDGMDNTIHVLSTDGVVLGVFGGSGGGPAEFQTARQIEVMNRSVVVQDVLLNRQASFGLDGSHRSTVTRSPGTKLESFRLLREDVLVGRTLAGVQSGVVVDSVTMAIVVQMGGDSSALDTIASGWSSAGVWFEDGQERFGHALITPFGDAVHFATIGDSLVVVADGDRGTVAVFGAGPDGLQPLGSFPTVSEIQPVSREELQDALEKHLSTRRGGTSPRSPRAHAKPFWSSVHELLIGEGGEIWLAENSILDFSESQSWNVMNLSGEWLGRVRFPAGFKLKEVGGTKFFGIRLTDLDLTVLEVFDRSPSPCRNIG